jgi:hypothetical protein
MSYDVDDAGTRTSRSRAIYATQDFFVFTRG